MTFQRLILIFYQSDLNLHLKFDRMIQPARLEVETSGSVCAEAGQRDTCISCPVSSPLQPAMVDRVSDRTSQVISHLSQVDQHLTECQLAVLLQQ